VLQEVYKAAKDANHNIRIICIGSTTDRTSKASDWIYQQEKKALRNYCNSLGLLGTWSGGPRVTLLSFGTLSNNQHKHPNRTCMDIDVAANYVKWILDQPSDISINELSIDPLQENKNVQ
jgi:NADP-dependent 3-hydroxy acid dehydrogenase YdfG